ncbi:MAG: hypothetical protein H0X29_09585 [Parachlamydiaceae bacterium]|nr:hypothetical protein [Parachlamydiaceae bacterium]
MNPEEAFTLHKNNIWAVPIIHYNMELAAQVRLAFDLIKPDCVAVELAETMQLQLLHAASRLPDISIAITYDKTLSPLYYLCEPCDGAFEALRSAQEAQIAAWCIDLDVDYYPNVHEYLPDPYAIQRIGLKNYYEAYQKLVLNKGIVKSPADHAREMYMAKRLKELSLRYDRVLFVGGMSHVESILKLVDSPSFPVLEHAERSVVELCTLTEESCREVMAEFGWVSRQYEALREKLVNQPPSQKLVSDFPPDRQKIIYHLFRDATEQYIQNTGNAFPKYHIRNIMKFLRNYALIRNQLMPDLFQILTAGKSCVDDNYAYELWQKATEYPFRRNIDNLLELDLSIQDVWGKSKNIRFHLKQKSSKTSYFQRHRKDRSKFRLIPPGPFSICSYPPEDGVIEKFGEFLKKKGTQILTEESARTIPFSSSIEDGVDTRETIRHWHEKTLYVKTKGKPPGGVGSVVIIFDEDSSDEENEKIEKYSWQTTWLGEHVQESDMAFYATPLTDNVIGPGISRCEYGGFMMSYPPRRLYDVWSDADYQDCRTKAEVLLMAAIDYAVKPLITYVAAKPPRTALKSYARRFGKKVVYFPIGQLSPITLNKLRAFHVLDGHNTRNIAGEYIF